MEHSAANPVAQASSHAESRFFPKFVSRRYLLAKKREAFITIISVSAVLGVAIGVMVLTMTMAIMSGFEQALRDKIVGSTHIVIFRSGGEIYGVNQIAKAIESTPGVARASSFVQQQVLLRAGNQASGVMLKGIDPASQIGNELKRYVLEPALVDDLGKMHTYRELKSDGSTLEVELPPVLIGGKLADRIGVIPGSAVSLFSPQVSSTPFGLVPRYRRFVVAGIFRAGAGGYEDALIYTGLNHGQSFFRLDHSVTGFEVMVDNVNQSQGVAEALVDRLNSGPNRGYLVQDWTELNKELWEAIQLEKLVYFIVLLLLIVLASFSIVSTLVMIVIEKRRDIAVLLTLGATRRQIARVFRMQGLTIGVVGTLLGLVLGFTGCTLLDYYGFPLPENVFPTSTVPVQMDALNFVVIGICDFIICML
ncbi:MAG: ABC transporter permease, partial [Bdellovibrionales bacterium]|nr:ABC transporter permease [Bdellovibrionales bacterium]